MRRVESADRIREQPGLLAVRERGSEMALHARHDRAQSCTDVRDASGREIWLEVDGGVKVENISEIARAGADTFVAGSAIFGTRDYKATIGAMRAELAKA